MNRRVFQIVCFYGIVAPACALAAGMNLDESYQAALQRSNIVAQQQELIVQAEERIRQAKGAMFPTISGVASYLRQESSSISTTGTSSSPNSQPLVKVTGTQPIFRGLREFAALRGTKELAKAQTHARKRAAILLFEDTAQAFYTRLTLAQDLKNLDEEIELYSAREKELEERVRIGRSAVSEVLTLRSSADALRAQLEQVKGQRFVAEETFAFLTGLPGDGPIADSEILPTQTEPLDAYLSRLSDRPDVQADLTRLDAAKATVWVAKGAYFPSVDLTGNYYIWRTGPAKNSDWDVLVFMTVPLFEGGITESKIREALSQQKMAELTYEQTRRQSEEEIRTRHRTVGSDIAQVQAFEKAARAAEKTYQVQKSDYRLGLVTNLDVLQALTNFEESKRAMHRTQFSTKLDQAKLESSVLRRPKSLGGN